MLMIVGVAALAMYMLNRPFTIQFNTGEGEVIASQTVTPRNPMNLETRRFMPIRPGWTFMGWIDDGGNVINNTNQLRASAVLEARWERDSYFAQMYVEGVRVRTIQLDANARIAPADLNSPAGGWIVTPNANTSFDRFFGWRFYDILGNRNELMRDHINANNWWIYSFTWNTGLQQWVSQGRRAVNVNNPFEPDLYDTSFHAIVDYYRPDGGGLLLTGSRPVATVFNHADTSLPPQLGMHFRDDITIPAFSDFGSPAQFLGWRIDLPTSNNEQHNRNPLTGAVTSVTRLGHDVDDEMRRHDIARLNNQILSRIFMPGESFNLDTILHYIAWTPSGLSGVIGQWARTINFSPVFWGDGNAANIEGAERFYVRTTAQNGDISLRAITDTFDLDAMPVHIEGAGIVLQRPNLRPNMRFVRYRFFVGSVETVINYNQLNVPFVVTMDTLSPLGVRGLVIEMEWAGISNVTVHFDFVGNLNSVYYIHRLTFVDGQPRTSFTEANNITELIQSRSGDVITLPSASMFATPNKHFSHWEFRQSGSNNIHVGSAGHAHIVNGGFVQGGEYTLHAVWVDSQVNFAFNLNGGRNFAPNMHALRGTTGETRAVPSQIPQRYGYNFLYWQLGTGSTAQRFHPTAGDHLRNLTIAQRRQELVARWQPRIVRVMLEYSFVNQINQPVIGTLVEFSVPFDSSVQLRNITTPAYFDTVRHVGWQFVDMLNGGVMDFSPTQLIRIDEDFTTRAVGSLDESALFPTANIVAPSVQIRGQDIKEGRQFAVDLFNQFDPSGVLDQAAMFTWNGPITIVNNGIPQLVPRWNTINHSTFTSRMSNVGQVGVGRHAAYAQKMATHDLVGVIYISNAAAISLFGANPITTFFNIDTGMFDGGTAGGLLAPFRFMFGSNGDVVLPAPSGNMRMYKLWRPKEIIIQVYATVSDGGAPIANIAPIPSYHGDQRARTFITNDGNARTGVGEVLENSPTRFVPFTLAGGAVGVAPGERFIFWRVEYIFNVNGVMTPYPIITLVPYGLLGIDRFHINNSLFAQAPVMSVDDISWPIARINMTRATQDNNTFIIRVENHNFRNDGDRLTFGIAAGGGFAYDPASGGSLISNIRQGGGQVNFPMPAGFSIDPNLNTFARSRGYTVSGFSTSRIDSANSVAVNNPFVIGGGTNPVGQIFIPGMAVNLVNFGEHIGHNTPAGASHATAQINADAFPMITLFPIFQIIQYNIIIFAETDGGVQSMPITSTHSINASFSLVTDAYMASPASFAALRMQRFGFSLEFVTQGQGAGVVNVGRFDNRNLFALNRSDFTYSIGDLVGSVVGGNTVLNLDWIQSNNEIHLWVNWVPRQVFIQHSFVQAGHWITQTIPMNTGQRFGESFNMFDLSQLGMDTTRIGFTHMGWTLTNQMTGITSDFSVLASFITGSPGNVMFVNIANHFFNLPSIDDNVLILEATAWYSGWTLPQLHFVLQDRDVSARNVYYLPSQRTVDNGANNWFRSSPHFSLMSFGWRDTAGIDHQNFGIFPSTDSRYVLTHNAAVFGSRIPIDMRTQVRQFTGAWTPAGSRDYGTARFEYWYYMAMIEGVLVERRIVPEWIQGFGGVMRPHFALTDTALINATNTGFAIPYLVIFPRFSPMDTNLFTINDGIIDGTTQGSMSRMTGTESEFLQNIISNTAITNHTINSTNYIVQTPAIDVGGRMMTRRYTTNMNVYHEFVHGAVVGGNFVDNRFIRWGYELIGFAAYTNNGVVNGPLQRREFLQGDMLLHAYLIENDQERPEPLPLIPIWRAMRVRLEFLANTGETINNFPVIGNQTFGNTHPSFVNGHSTHGPFVETQNIAGSIVVPFESHLVPNGGLGVGFSLPIFTPQNNASLQWHSGFTYSMQGNLGAQSNFIDLISEQERASSFLIAHDGLRDQFLNLRLSGINYNPNNSATWPRIVLQAQWSTAGAVSVNFHMNHSGATNITLNHVLHGHTMQIPLRPSVDPANVNRYMLDGYGQFLTRFRLPTRLEFTNVPNLGVQTSQGWRFQSHLLQWIDMGAENEYFIFINGQGPVIGSLNFNITLFYS